MIKEGKSNLFVYDNDFSGYKLGNENHACVEKISLLYEILSSGIIRVNRETYRRYA